MNVVLLPVPGHPIIIDKPDEECTHEPIPSLYKEDGSLEVIYIFRISELYNYITKLVSVILSILKCQGFLTD